jgi:elongation factor 2
VQNVQRTALMMGDQAEAVQEIPCGNTCALVGIDKYLTKQGTITDSDQANKIRLMKYSVSPVVKVAVKPKNPSDLPKLIEGLSRLSKGDQLVEISTEPTGEHVVAGCGELHLEVCLRDLEMYSQCEFVTSEPVVTYKETVLEESSKLCLSKAPNRHNRLWATAQPLGEELTNAIEEGKVTPRMEAKALQRELTEKYDWDPNDAKKIWYFEPNMGSNMLVDQTKGVQYMNEIQPHVVAGFQEAAREGVLANEQVRGVRLNLKEANLIADSIHRGAGQIIPPARSVFYASCLTAEPRFQEPMLLCEIQTPDDAMGGIYSTLSKRRGMVIGEEPIQGTPMMIVKAYLPVSESFGFNQLLRAQTSGRAFPQMVFDHWATMPGDPLEAGSKANILCEQIRKRKGLTPSVKPLEHYNDKL